MEGVARMETRPELPEEIFKERDINPELVGEADCLTGGDYGMFASDNNSGDMFGGKTKRRWTS